jgi:nanoRNase/pAp phosphatase (c-di-AMP/oligoRNAs hydrolase)
MLNQEIIDQFKLKISETNSIVIAMPSDPSEDILAAGLGLFLTLKQTKQNTNIGCSSAPKVGSARIFGIDQITDNLGNQNMIITLDFSEEKLEKIDYNTSDGGKKIELHVIPRSGESPPTGDQIHINFAGAKADLVITLGINSLEELGKLYATEKEFFDTTPVISISQKSQPDVFATVSVNSPSAASISELTAYLLKQSSMTPESDPATNLLSLMVRQSDHFSSPKTSPESLETAAFLMRQIKQQPVPTQNQQLYTQPTGKLT